MTWKRPTSPSRGPRAAELLARVYRPGAPPPARCRPSSTCTAARGRASTGRRARFSAAGWRRAGSWSSRSTSAWAPITSTPRRAPTWPRVCGGCAPTRAGSASIPQRVGHRRQLERRPPRLAPRRRARRRPSTRARRSSCPTARSTPRPAISAWRSRMVAYPVCDPLARYRYVLSRKDEAPDPDGFSAQRLIDAHHGFFRDEAHMAEASVTRIVASGEAGALPPMWVGQPETGRQRARRHHRRLRRRVSARGRRRSSARTSRAPGTASCRARAGRRRRAWR